MPASSASICPKCAGEFPEGWRVCPAYLAPLDGASAQRHPRTDPGASP